MYKIRIPIFLNKNIEKYERIKPGTCCVWKNIAKKLGASILQFDTIKHDHDDAI